MSCTTILYKIRGQSLDQTPIRICSSAQKQQNGSRIKCLRALRILVAESLPGRTNSRSRTGKRGWNIGPMRNVLYGYDRHTDRRTES
jgi:hypothetical protein